MAFACLRAASGCSVNNAVVMNSKFVLNLNRPRHKSLLFEVDENRDIEQIKGLIEVADIGI